MALNTSSSIVDFLKARGMKPTVGEQFPFFNERAKLFETYGLGTADTFRGEAGQNSTLLNKLIASEKNVGVSITPENLFTIAGQAMGTSAVAPAVPQNQPPVEQGVATPIATPPTDTSQVPDYLMTLAGKASSAQMTPDQLAQSAIEKFTTSPDYALSQESATADKAGIQLKAQADTESFIKNIASRGLIFSGAKTSGVSSIEVDKMAKLLDVDRSFAKIIVQGLETSAKEIAKDAQAGQQDAIDALDKLGYVVAGDRIVQKPSEARAQQASDLALAKAEEPKLLSPTEAATLGVPYGTTQEEAAGMGITPDRYKDAEKVVPWSQWAAENGLVGAPIELATQVAVQQAQDKKASDKDRQLSSLKANVLEYVRQIRAKETTATREQFLIQLQGDKNFDMLSKGDISAEVYGLTKELEPERKTAPVKKAPTSQIGSAWQMIKTNLGL